MQFAFRVLRMAERLPRGISGRTIADQVARSGTSVASNYRAAIRAKSRSDFLYKINVVLEEADETEFWIELAARTGIVPAKRLSALAQEANELVRIFNATRASCISNHRS